MMLQRAVTRTASLAALSALAAIGAGCESKGWLDPTEVGRFEKTPLVVPILDKLVVGVEADEAQFAGAREVRAEDLAPSSVDYRIGPSDMLQVSIQDLAGAGTVTTEMKRVSESGNVSLSYVGQVPVRGLTEAEAEKAIADAYIAKDILQPDRAIVSVTVTESQARRFNVTGSITRPGAYPLYQGDLRLLDALAMAGDVTSQVGIDYVYVLRRKDEGTTTPTPTEPGVTPGTPGVDPLAPTSRGNAPAAKPAFLMIQPADEPVAPQSPQEARAAAERLARELEAARNAADPAAADPARPVSSADDRVIQIEGAGTQPATGLDPGMTTIPPVASTPPAVADAATSFEFTAPSEPTDQEIIRIPFGQLKAGELKYNVIIRSQDTIIIPAPPIGEYYMHAHAARPGVYSLTARKITLTMAVTSAGGMDALAIPARTEIVRRIGPNQQMMVRVDLERIFAGLEPDVYLKPDDQVRIGSNGGAIFLASLRNAFRVTYGFGFLYDRNYAPIRRE